MNFDNESSEENKNDDIVRIEQTMKRIKNKLDLFKYKKRLKQVELYNKARSLQPVSYYVNSEIMNKIC